MKKYISKSLNDTKKIAIKLSKIVKNKPLLLNGELGAGKTTLVKFIGKELGVKENIVSPTFNILKIYDNLVHIDAYKISGNIDEYEEYFEDKPIIIEWSNNLDLYFDKYIKIDVYMENDYHVYHILEDC